MKIMSFHELAKINFSVDKIQIIPAERQPGYTVLNTKGRRNNGFVYIYGGSIKITRFNDDSSEESFDIVEGNLVYIPYQYKYKTVFTGQITKLLTINFNIIDEHGNNIFLENIRIYDNSKKYLSLWNQIIECSNMVSDIKNIYAKSLLYSLFYRIITDETTNLIEPKYKILLPAIRKLESDFKEALHIPDLVKLSHISETLFRKLFREFTEMSPIEYRNNLRIKRACELLQSRDYSVKEAAEETGFNNISYFCRLYYKLTGNHASDEY